MIETIHEGNVVAISYYYVFNMFHAFHISNVIAILPNAIQIQTLINYLERIAKNVMQKL